MLQLYLKEEKSHIHVQKQIQDMPLWQQPSYALCYRSFNWHNFIKLQSHKKMLNGDLVLDKDVVVQFYPWFTFYFPLCWGMVMYNNEVKTKGNKI